ncbi:MAG: pyruvate dehydrogenase (acetyl-transferring) E1 component subunit alpha [Acidobacteria bacterium]|nr:pyruvate dehydrogenase (acetyl-transferring) E1 component subunit alpha [Acidobacteriota bacterium]MBI3656265.1 pyruvate dehydrogenase (acetyl-transferring) E1 component subunit alpha [Acidobacteriota bacterium]
MVPEVAAEDLISVLSENGIADKAVDPNLSNADLLNLYRLMVFNRVLDERMVKLQRQGRIGFYIGSVGEEATVMGSAFALQPQDWIFPSYREAGAAFLRGFPLRAFLCQLMGNREDLTKGRQMPNHFSARPYNIVSISSPVGTQLPQAVGAAMAARYRGDDSISLAYFGDGTSSEGDFHVALNFAGVYKAPVIFVCRNNQWAISVPLNKQTASATIAIKAKAYGIDGVRVDGNDLPAVYQVTAAAAAKARSGGGATLIEAVTYRLSGHSTSDDPRVYRPEDEVAQWKGKDPILRFRLYLEKKGIWTTDEDAELFRRVDADIVTTLKEVEAIPSPPAESLFDDVYAQVPPHLAEQQASLWAAQKEDH